MTGKHGRAIRFSALLLALLVLVPGSYGLALVTPTPTTARPVIVGTTAYSNILFGKMQRAAALWGTNLGRPMTIVQKADKEQTLTKCLWNQFGMASPGSDGTLAEQDLVKPLSSWVPQADLKDTLVFFDATSVAPEPSLLSFKLPFGKKKEETAIVPTINADILQCAVDRGCAHVYVLANDESVGGCYAALERYASRLPSTILVLEGNGGGITMEPTPGWATSRPQNMEGEFLAPVSMRPRNNNNNKDPEEEPTTGTSMNSHRNAVLPAEDVAEVMLQAALRTDRTFLEYPRVVTIAPGATAGGGDDALVERRNADYFTLTTSAQAGTVQSVASWKRFLAPLGGEVNADLGKRPDQIL